MIDEVDEARVGEMEVLEDHDHGRRGGEALEECSPRSEQLFRADRLGVHAEQGEEGRLDPATLFHVGDVLLEYLGDLPAGGRIVVRLQEARPPPDHLAQRPEADSLAVRG